MKNPVKHFIDLKHVRELMNAKGIDEKQFAKLLGVTPPTAKKFLNGANQSNLRPTFLCRLADAFDVTIDSLMFECFRKKV